MKKLKTAIGRTVTANVFEARKKYANSADIYLRLCVCVCKYFIAY